MLIATRLARVAGGRQIGDGHWMAGSREARLAELLAPPDTRRHRHRRLTADLLLAGACVAGYALAASGRLWPAWAVTTAAVVLCLGTRRAIAARCSPIGVMAFACYCVSVRAFLRTGELARLDRGSEHDARAPGHTPLRYWLTAVAPALLALLLAGVSQALANPEVAWSP